MANKRYDQFSVGSRASTQIILTADPSTGELGKVTLGELNILPYTVYRAIIDQSTGNTGNPTETELENTLGEDITWTRGSAGVFTGTSLNPVFTANKTHLLLHNQNGNQTYITTARRIDVSNIEVNVGSGGSFFDEQLFETSIQIIVYP